MCLKNKNKLLLFQSTLSQLQFFPRMPLDNQQSPSPSHAHSPTRVAREALRKSPGLSLSLPSFCNSPTNDSSFLRTADNKDLSGNDQVSIKQSHLNFSWDELCLYLYGHLSNDPVALKHSEDQTSCRKRTHEEGELSTEKAGRFKEK